MNDAPSSVRPGDANHGAVGFPAAYLVRSGKNGSVEWDVNRVAPLIRRESPTRRFTRRLVPAQERLTLVAGRYSGAIVRLMIRVAAVQVDSGIGIS